MLGVPRKITKLPATGVSFGKHGYAPGIGEDIVPRRTLWERFIDWLHPAPWAAEEREALLQHARRIKLKTDLQEARIRRRKERAEIQAKIDEVERPVAVVSFKWTHGGNPATADILLWRGHGCRGWTAKAMRTDATGTELGEIGRTAALNYLRGSRKWLLVIDAWVTGAITDEELSNRPFKYITMVKECNYDPPIKKPEPDSPSPTVMLPNSASTGVILSGGMGGAGGAGGNGGVGGSGGWIIWSDGKTTEIQS